MSDNVTWTPVEDEWDDESCGGTSSIGWDGKVISIVQDGEMMWHAPASDIRLCRAIPTPQWSQKPPTKHPMWTWFMGDIYPDNEPNKMYRFCSESIALYVAFGQAYWSIYDYEHNQPICSTGDCQGWWRAATVPHPPEVTP